MPLDGLDFGDEVVTLPPDALEIGLLKAFDDVAPLWGVRLERSFFHGMTMSMRLNGVDDADIMNLYGLHGPVPPEYMAP